MRARGLLLLCIPLLILTVASCASASYGGANCAGKTESPHYSVNGQVLIVKTRYGCDQPGTAVDVRVTIEKKAGGSWSTYRTQTHELKAASANKEYTVYTDANCTPGRYRASTEILRINGNDVPVKIDRDSAERETDCVSA